MEPVRNDTTTDRRTAVELAKRLLVDLIWRTAKIEVDGVTFPDTQEIFDGRGIEYEAQAKTENGKKPDFLFPSQAAYEDPAFPEEQLRMLASKTSIKDRFRQVADEANRIRDKHLFTLTPGDVTHPKLAQLDELHIHLVMPKVVKESYDDLIQGETMTFSRFIEEIQGLQAGRPQSLTLL